MNFELEQRDIVQLAEAVAERINTPNRWLTRQEAAEYLRCSTKYLDQLVRGGEIAAHYLAERKPLFSVKDLDLFVHQTRRDL